MQEPDRLRQTPSARPGLLASIRQARSVEDAAAARQLDLAARWADLHPPESIHSAAAFTVPPPRTPPLPVRGAGGVSASGQDDAGHVQPMP